MGTERECSEKVKAMMWLLNLSDGNHDLFKIAERSGLNLSLLISVCGELSQSGLLVEQNSSKRGKDEH
jgi:aminopeptidase-like protein